MCLQAALPASSSANGTTTLFKKTKLCKFDAVGACTKGFRCSFAHGKSELQPLPNFHCTKMCPHVMELGFCDDPTCHFAHERSEIRRRKPADILEADELVDFSCMTSYPSTPADFSRQMSRTFSGGEAHQEITFSAAYSEDQFDGSIQKQPDFESLLLKTKMCKFFLAGGCSKGASCSYAHTQEELQPLPDLRRTKLCPLVRKFGVCEDRLCTFAHAPQEVRHTDIWHDQASKNLTKEALALAASRSAQGHNALDESSFSEGGESTNASGQAHGEDDCNSRSGSEGWTVSSEQGSGSSISATNSAHKALFFKTRMCKFYPRGTCSRGALCKFAHTPDELRPEPEMTSKASSSSFLSRDVPSLELPSVEGNRVLVAIESQNKYFLAVKNGFFTVDCEAECSEAAARHSRRAHSLPARRSVVA